MKRFSDKRHPNTWMLNWNVSMITDVFLDQNRVNVCEHTVKTTPYSLLIEKDVCEYQNFSVEASMCLCVPFIRISLQFLCKSSFFNVCVIRTSVLCFPRGLIYAYIFWIFVLVCKYDLILLIIIFIYYILLVCFYFSFSFVYRISKDRGCNFSCRSKLRSYTR